MQPLWETVWRFLKKLKIELPYNPAISLLGMYLEKTKTLIQKDSWATMLMLALLTVAKIWKQPKWPSTSEWIKKMWHFIYFLYIYTISHKKEWNIAIGSNMDGPTDYQTKWSKSEKDKYHVASFICEIQINNINELICKAETDFQTKKTNLWLPKGKLRVKN